MSKPASDRQRSYIASLRAELGNHETSVPPTSVGASRLISALLRRKEATSREAERASTSAKPAGVETRRSIEALAERLGVEVLDSWLTEGEARFVLDDLRARERRSRRVADGSLA